MAPYRFAPHRHWLGLISMGYAGWLIIGCSGTENSGSKGNASGTAGMSDAGSGPVPAAGTSNVGGTSAAGAGTGASGSATTGGAGGTATAGTGSTAGASTGGASTGGASGGGSSAGAASTGGAGAGGAATDDRSPEATCTRWKADTANMAEGTWSGSVATCTAGDISADGRENALRLFNLMRWLADLPAVVTEDVRNQQAQACALMMTANDALSHEPPMSWKCYSELGAKGAATSNISGGPGVSSVFDYMVDPGNETTFGHRRIILGNDLGPIGLGSAGKGGSSCMQNIGGTGKANKAWVAWPAAGAFPIQAYTDTYKRSLDDTGWSVQTKTNASLSGAQVTITSDGQAKPVKVEQLTGNYGNSNAIRIVPDGWKAAAGSTYSVSVTGISMPIAYEVQMIDCK